MPPKQKNNKAGRPREFKEEYIRQARIAFGEGFTDLKFCELIAISRDSLIRWRREYPEFGKAVQEGKDEFDTDKVEKSLFKRATGYHYTETIREPDVNGKLQVVKTISKHVADTTAMIFWLKNRRRDRWKDIKAVEASGPDGGPIPIRYVDADEPKS